MGIDFGSFGAEGCVDVANVVALFGQQVDDTLEDDFAIHVERFVARVGKMIADVAQIGCAKEGVADGMHEHIGVAMTLQPHAMWNFDAAQP